MHEVAASRGGYGSGRGAPWRRRGALLAVGALVFVASWSLLRAADARVLAAAGAEGRLALEGRLVGAAEVAAAARALRLVTVVVDTTVRSEALDESWRGDARASVTAPVRLHYGVDLAGMDVHRIALSPLTGACVVTLPRPERVAVEVLTETGEPDVRVGWLRLRAQAGEYVLGVARKGLPDRARALELGPREQELVERATEDQVRAVVRRILGGGEVAIVWE